MKQLSLPLLALITFVQFGYAQCGNYFKDPSAFIATYYEQTEACPNFPITLKVFGHSPTNTIYWDFGDGKTDTSPYHSFWTNHAYTSPGTYTATAKLTDDCGKDTTVSLLITIKDVPYFDTKSYIKSTKQTTCPGKSIFPRINGGFGLPDSTLWSFNNGLNSTSSYPSFKFDQEGVYPYYVKLTDYCFNDTVLYDTVYVELDTTFNNSLKGYAIKDTVCPGSVLDFNTLGTIYGINWTFPDGTTSTENKPTWTSFSTEGKHAYSVKITDECANEKTFTDSIIVGGAKIFDNGAKFHTETWLCPDEIGNFYTSGGVKSVQWTFADSVYTSKNFTKSWSVIDSYTYEVILTDNCNNKDTTTSYVPVIKSGNFSSSIYVYTEDSICPKTTERFLAQGEVKAAQWTFSNGFTSNDIKLWTEFDSIGDYSFSVKITDQCGNDSTFTGTFNIGPHHGYATHVYHSAHFDSICPGETGSISLWGDVDSIKWDFPGAKLDVYQSMAYVEYAQSGMHYYTITTIDHCGNQKVISDSLIVNKRVDAARDIYLNHQDTVCPLDDFWFTVSPKPTNVTWTFFDGQTASSYDDMISFDTTGLGSFSVTATDYCGNDTTLTGSFLILPYGGNCLEQQQNGIHNLRNNSLKAMPNPTDGITVLNLSSLDGLKSIKVFNQQGQLVLNFQTQKTKENIDFSGLPKGVYQLIVQSKSMNATSRIVYR